MDKKIGQSLSPEYSIQHTRGTLGGFHKLLIPNSILQFGLERWSLFLC